MNVTIIYNGPIVEEIRKGANIPRIFVPTTSYVDMPVMTEGYENTDQLGDKATYGKSIYATNVDDQGFLPGLLPMFSSTQNLVQFENAIFAAKAAKDAGTTNEGVTFAIEASEELYWVQIGKGLADEGFTVTVEPDEDPEP